MYPQLTPKTGTEEGPAIDEGLRSIDVSKAHHVAPAGAYGCSYLVIEGRAGFGAENGECSLSPLPIGEERLTRILLDHVADERMRVSADRNDAHCLGEVPAEEIALIPDRPTGLYAWIIRCVIDGDPDAFEGKSRALEAFLRLQTPAALATKHHCAQAQDRRRGGGSRSDHSRSPRPVAAGRATPRLKRQATSPVTVASTAATPPDAEPLAGQPRPGGGGALSSARA